MNRGRHRKCKPKKVTLDLLRNTIIKLLEKYPYRDYWVDICSPENYSVDVISNRTIFCEYWIDDLSYYQLMLTQIDHRWHLDYSNGFTDNDWIKIRIRKIYKGIVEEVILTNKSILYE